jgi:iron complex outermembrane receptor protein
MAAAVRGLAPVLVVTGLLWAGQLGAQATTGTISGRVVDSTSQQPLSNVTIAVPGTQLGALTRNDGGFVLTNVPVGTQRVRASRIGYGAKEQPVTVNAGATASTTFSLSSVAASLSEVVVVGYGTQRREAITGAVATVQAEEANVGVIQNANQMLTGRVAGVNITQNNGEPGGGLQIRVRGGTSISANNEPLYVVDGVPLQNESAVAGGIGIGGGGAALARNPLNTLNPNDIASITVLKDASATAIYGSRGANGVVLIETKKGRAGQSQITYETYVGASTRANELDLVSGDQYRSFVEQQISAGNLPATTRANLGSANTNWQEELARTGYAQSHNLSFSGGSEATQYRAALNYFDQQGVIIANGLERFQGRVNASNQSLGGRLQTGLNLTASRVNNRFLPYENGTGFEGAVFTNMVAFNPTRPVTIESGSFYEIGPGGQSDRNPVALARQITDQAPENRVLGNLTASYSLFSSLTARVSAGADFANSVRQTYVPIASPVGFSVSGRARQAERTLQNSNLQTLLTFTPRISESQELEVVGGYEYTTFNNSGFAVEVTGFRTDAFRFDNLGAGNALTSPADSSYREKSLLSSFFSRVNYGFRNRYFLTGVVRYDGSSRLAEGNQWQLFPAISGSWRLSEEAFLRDGPFSNLSLRAGWGRQGNQAVRPYQTQLLLRTNPGARYPFGNEVVTGFAASQVGNPDLKWETSTQTNVGLDYGFADNRFSGSVEVYQKNTRDLLLEVDVPQPAVVRTRIENVGRVKNRGLEASLDAQLFRGDRRSFSSGLVLTVERNEVDNLGVGRDFITTSDVQGQGQSGRRAQRLIPGQPIGTFWGATYVGLNDGGKQLFRCARTAADCVGGTTTSPAAEDEGIIGNANPDFILGLRSNGTFGRFDASWLWNAQVGQDVFNNTALIYATTAATKQGRGFLASALTDQTAFGEPSIYSSRWIESGSFARLQNVTLGYNFTLPGTGARPARVFVSGDNLLLFTDYSGYDPEVFTRAGGTDVVGVASRGIDYLAYPRARTFTTGISVQF